MQAQHITVASGPRVVSLPDVLMILQDGDRVEFRPRRTLQTEWGPTPCDPTLIIRWRSGRITETDVWDDDGLESIRRLFGD